MRVVVPLDQDQRQDRQAEHLRLLEDEVSWPEPNRPADAYQESWKDDVLFEHIEGDGRPKIFITLPTEWWSAAAGPLQRAGARMVAPCTSVVDKVRSLARLLP